MVKKIWYLGTCSTCTRIIKQLGDTSDFEMIEIKSSGVSRNDLDELVQLTGGTYADFFSKRAMKYRAMGLHEREVGADEMGDLITSEYTFLKRPVIQIGDQVFIGNAKKVVEAAVSANGN